jgi:hypothetical protein
MIYSLTVCRAQICKPYKEPSAQESIPVRQPDLTYRPAGLHRLAESIPGLLKRLQILALFSLYQGLHSLTLS